MQSPTHALCYRISLTHTCTHTHSLTHTCTHSLSLTHTCTLLQECMCVWESACVCERKRVRYKRMHSLCSRVHVCDSAGRVQGGQDSQDPLSCRSFSTKEPLDMSHFCGKWPIKIRDPMSLGHPVYLSVTRCVHLILRMRNLMPVTGWPRLIGSLIFIGHFPQKWLVHAPCDREVYRVANMKNGTEIKCEKWYRNRIRKMIQK